MTYQQLLKKGRKEARKLGLEEEAIRLLVLELSGLDGANFLANIDKDAPIEVENKILAAFSQYYEGHPVQHIIGYTYFFGYKVIVNGDVLIPRPETEELIGYVLATYDQEFKGENVTVADIGTGSGNIALALAKEEAKMKVYATDISEDALNIAKENAKNNDASITFMQGDMLEPLIKEGIKLDILVSNPPYIPDSEYVEPVVKDYEPHVALFGGVDGLNFYKQIFEKAHLVLKPHAIMAFEHSHTKGKEMLSLAKTYFPNSNAEVIKDLNGKDRFLIVIIGGEDA